MSGHRPLYQRTLAGGGWHLGGRHERRSGGGIVVRSGFDGAQVGCMVEQAVEGEQGARQAGGWPGVKK
jgi:hypothetical protein